MVTGVSTKKKAKTAEVKMTAPALRLLDATSILEGAWDEALAYCTAKLGCGDARVAMERFSKGDPTASGYCGYSLAQRIAKCLGEMDKDVKGVYLFENEATPDDLCFAETERPAMIHLLIWTERRTAALNALLAALNAALAEGYANLFGVSRPRHLLDTQITDNAEVKERVGYGALLVSLQHRPIEVWRR